MAGRRRTDQTLSGRHAVPGRVSPRPTLSQRESARKPWIVYF